MIEKIYRILAMVLLAVVAGGCVYDYEPSDDDIQGLDSPLVVIDGDIVVGGKTAVSVSYTSSLAEEEVEVPLGASVWVEDSNGEIWHGEELDGELNRFEVDTRGLSTQGTYRLGVSIPGRGEYFSEFKKVLVSPAIDSITWSVASDRSYARVEVTTHNSNSGEKLYCKWNYTENWESYALYPAIIDYDYKYGRMVELSEEEIASRQFCFSCAESVQTHIANTEKLSDNLISKFVVNNIPNVDSRLMGLYAILVRQTALDKEAYIYWENVKKNSSEAGGLFAPQPSEVKGNLESATVPGEIVIGYVNVTTQTDMRVFIDWSEEGIYSSNCEPILVYSGPEVTDADKEDPGPVYWNTYYNEGYRPIRYPDSEDPSKAKPAALWALEKCTNCKSYSNGSRPEFWPSDR